MEIAMANIRNDVSDTFLSVKFELLKYLKNRRLLIVAVLAVIVPLLFYIRVPNTSGVFAATVLDTVGVFIIIAAALFAGDAVNSEFEKKTNLLSFSTPQSRASIFVGKYIAALLATFFVAMLYYVTMTLQTAQIYGWGEIPKELGKSFLVALFCSASAVSVIFFFSSFMKRSMTSTIVGALFIMWVLETVRMIVVLLHQEPWFVATYSGQLLKDVLGTNSQFGDMELEMQKHIKEQFNITISLYRPDFGVGLVVLAGYAIVGFVSGMVLALRKED